ncbi:MAG TPA: glutamate-cysteine ligase family protein [Candidatus Eisenbacteria bacterium]|nr:glutamate-cysteine ligase family protein [Candidatus Eisenbacteria bacterium]
MLPIRKKDELEAFFHESGKPRAGWRIGTEYEKVGIDRSTGKAIPYSGRRGVEAILRELIERYGWEPEEQDGHIIALKRGTIEIHLEPGGQIELSGEPCETIHCTSAEFTQHIRELIEVTEPLEVVFLGLGMQPVSTPAEIEWVPKKRYRIMAPYMAKVGSLGHRMMKQTATVQANIDFGDERDAMAKFRAGMGLSPLIIAMFANSPICDGELTEYRSMREHIWTDTDRARSGLLRFAFLPEVSFAHYVEYALDVPMYFIIRNGDYVDMTEVTFRQFMARGHKGHHATIEDWGHHLTTLFPETRIKRYIEIRSADSQPPELMPALPALIKGAFYDSDCLQAAWDLVKDWSWEERMEAYLDSHRSALAARVRRHPLSEYAKELFQIAWEGLRRQRALNQNGDDETIYLIPLKDLLFQGKCPADVLVEKWQGELQQDIKRLIAYSAYKLP